MGLQRLREAAEKAKIELSSTAQTDINLPYITSRDNQPLHFVKQLTRAKFDQMTSGLVERAIKCAKNALKNAKLSPSDIDEVILEVLQESLLYRMLLRSLSVRKQINLLILMKL
jgi:molecular chaperone DnaK